MFANRFYPAVSGSMLRVFSPSFPRCLGNGDLGLVVPLWGMSQAFLLAGIHCRDRKGRGTALGLDEAHRP